MTQKVNRLWLKASENCRLATNYDKAGQYMLKAADASADSETKIQLAMSSCEIMIDEERMQTSRDHFQKSVNLIMREGAHAEVTSIYLGKQIFSYCFHN